MSCCAPDLPVLCDCLKCVNGKMGIDVPTHDLDHNRIAEALESFAGADCPRALARIADGSEFLPRCSVGRLDLLLVGQYMETWGTTAYWEIILRGGMPGYSLCLHELTEIAWYFRRYNINGALDPYERIRRLQPSGDFRFDQQEGYNEAHARALLVEHRYVQLRAREVGEDFSLRELVVANPHGGDLSEEDWDLLYRKYKSRLTELDKTIIPDNLERVRRWYERQGYRRPD